MRSAKHALLGSAAITLVTYACFHAHIGIAFAWPLYLLVVLFFSLSGDVTASIFVSLLSAGSLDYFFVDPLFRLTVSNPKNALALVSFSITAVTVATLVSRARSETQIAELQRKRMQDLYWLAQQLLALQPESMMGVNFLEPFKEAFGIKAVCFFDPATGEANNCGVSDHRLADRTREAFFFAKDVDDTAAGITVRRTHVQGEITGVIGFEGLEHPSQTSGPLVALTAALQERTRAFRDISQSAAAAQTEIYRSAVLDAFAHEFKTPLSTILAAGGGLRASRPLSAEQMDMAETVEAEASRLASLASRLLHVARLDREEVHPRMEAIDLIPLAHQTVEQYMRLPTDRRISFELLADRIDVVADPELIRLALSQLLDNACKYSLPGSTVSVKLDRQPDGVALRVTNSGSSIPSGERKRIFERFYRGVEARRFTSGSGLGLYVARKIVVAHGGALELESEDLDSEDLDRERSTSGRVTFCLRLPSMKGELQYAAVE